MSIEEQILLYLSYWHKYRTLFHVATSYGVRAYCFKNRPLCRGLS
ncbi:hypothetical protein [Acinetobacter junii]